MLGCGQQSLITWAPISSFYTHHQPEPRHKLPLWTLLLPTHTEASHFLGQWLLPWDSAPSQAPSPASIQGGLCLMPPQASAGGRMCSSAKGGVRPWTSPEPTGGQWALAACCVQGLGSGPMPGHCPVLPPPTLASLQSSVWEAVLQVAVNKSPVPLRWDPCGEVGGRVKPVGWPHPAACSQTHGRNIPGGQLFQLLLFLGLLAAPTPIISLTTRMAWKPEATSSTCGRGPWRAARPSQPCTSTWEAVET